VQSPVWLEGSCPLARSAMSGHVASMLYRIGHLYRTVMIASLGGDFDPPHYDDRLELGM
jgi:hypothetical protein